jgi:hypothetical protein
VLKGDVEILGTNKRGTGLEVRSIASADTFQAPSDRSLYRGRLYTDCRPARPVLASAFETKFRLVSVEVTSHW